MAIWHLAMAMMATLAGGAAEPAQEGSASIRGREVALFNGRDLTGWTHYLVEPDAPADRVWTVDRAARVLICRGNPIGYIRTVRDYTNFILRLEWRFNPVTRQAGNSGVLLRVVGEDKIWPRSVEAQLMSGNAGDIWLIDGARLTTPPERVEGRRIRATRYNERPIGEWNQYEITVDGGRISLRVNGVLVNEGTDAEVVPGKIALQSEGAEIHFRNIRLTPLRPR
ncbi:MAG TPA: DUF1080 domain-containing protein [Chthonomonadales bacterium]|nr:DUF1080 domain-containing protein [Chthonomonadales bacterium]